MTLLEILYSVQHIAQILAKPLDMSLEQYNAYLRDAQNDIFKEYADGYNLGNGAIVDSRVEKALNPFKQIQLVNTLTLTDNGSYGFSCGFTPLNVNCYKILDAWARLTTDWVHVDIIFQNEISERMSNSITKPSVTYPVGFVDYTNNDYTTNTLPTFYIVPSQYFNCRISMLTKPTTPSLVITMVGGVATQSASSVALQIDSMFHTDIIRKILQYLGLSVGNEFITTAINNQKNAEK